MHKTISMIDKIAQLSHTRGDATALESVKRNCKISYSEIYEAIVSYGALLRDEYGINVGSKVIIACDSDPVDMIIAILSVGFCGGTAIPLKSGSTKDDALRIKRIALESSAKLIITDQNCIESYRQHISDIKIENADRYRTKNIKKYDVASVSNEASDYPFIILYTSGTTTTPKAVEIDDNALMNLFMAYNDADNRTEQSVVLCCMPLYHVMGLMMSALSGLYIGAHVVCMSVSEFYTDTLAWCINVARYKVSHTCISNYMVSMLTSSIDSLNESYDTKKISLSSMKSIVLAGERVNPITIDAFIKVAKPYGFDAKALNISYGLTESASTFTHTNADKILNRINTLDAGEVFSVGKTFSGYKIIIIDENEDIINDKLMLGEFCINGPSIIDCYCNIDSDNDMDKSFINIDGEKYFRTGDIGFFNIVDEDKEFYISNRNKDVLIIHGENYSPAVIEELAEQISPCVVKAAAFSTQSENSEAAILLLEERHKLNDDNRKEVANLIFDAVISQIGINIQEIVFSSYGSFVYSDTGKLKRYAMKNLYIDGAWEGEAFHYDFSSNDFDSIDTKIYRSQEELQEDLQKFIGKYLYRSDDIIEDDLIKLGINSLKLQMLFGFIKKKTGVDLPLSTIVECPNIKALSIRVYKHLKGNLKPVRVKNSNNNSINQNELSMLQKAYIAGRNEEIEWGGTACKLYIERDIKGLDIEKFVEAIKTLTINQDALRTIITDEGKAVIKDSVDIPISVYRPSEQDREKVIFEIRAEIENAILPLSEPLFRVALTELDPNTNEWRIHLHLDMIAFDATSIFIFWSQLMRAYNNLPLHNSTGKAIRSNMPDSISYDSDKIYWLNKDIPKAPELPWNSKAEKKSPRSFTRRMISFQTAEWEKIEKISQGIGISPTAMFLTLFSHILAGFGAGRNFTLSLTSAGRENDSLNVIGDFTDIILFEVNLHDENMADAARRIQNDILHDLSHRAFSSFDLMKEHAARGEDNELYPVVFTSMLGLDEYADEESPFDVNSYSRSSTPQVLLDHQLIPTSDGVMLCWDSVDDAFEGNILDKMFASYRELVYRALTNEFWKDTLRDIRTEKDIQIQASANDTSLDIPKSYLTDGYRRAIRKYSENIAVIHKDKSYSYAELGKRVGEFKALLKDKGVVKADLVMIQMNKSFDLIASIIAVVDMGAIYIPMPHDQPEARQENIYENACAKLMLTDGICSISSNIPTIYSYEADAYEADASEVNVDPESLAYIIYTSGSTGTPKGVAIRHDAAMNTILAVNEYVNLGAMDRVIGISSVSFDLSVYDIFGAISVGAAIVLPSEEERIDPNCILRLCKDYGVTFWNSVPALMSVFLDYCDAVGAKTDKLKIRNIILSGDWIPMDLYKHLKRIIPSARLTSMGGATEASIWSNYFTVSEIKPEWQSIPYGYPLPNQLFHVLDDLGRLCPCGVAGRLHIGGRGLAQEYYNEPDLTDKAFFVHRDSGERLYDTGDYGKYDESGMLIFLGRRDTQIKINGYRIEIGEIQSAFNKVGYPKNVVVVSDEGQRGKKLIAFIKNDTDVQEEELKKSVGNILPGYFIPDKIICIREFPYTSNSKLDRKALLNIYNNIGKTNYESEDITELSDDDLKIMSLIQEETKVTNLKPNDSLRGLGLSSLELIRLANKLESEMGYRASINDLIRYQRVNEILEYYRNTDIKNEKLDINKEDAENQIRIDKFEKEDEFYKHPVMEVIREELETVDVTSYMEISALGLSSLMVIRIANRLESIFGVRPSIHDMLRYRTLRDLIEFYENNTSNANDNSDVEEELTNLHPVIRTISETLNIHSINENDSFIRLAASSIELIRIGNKLEAMYGFKPKMQELATIENFNKLINYYKDAELKEDINIEEAQVRNRAVDLYNRCKDLDIIIWPEGDKLRFKAPHGTITPELKDELKKEKAILLDFLSNQNTITTQDLTPLQMAYVLGRQVDHVLGDISAHYYVEYRAKDLDIQRLQDAVNELIVRNEILRTKISPEGKVSVLRANPGYKVEIVDEDLENRSLRDEMKNHQFPFGVSPMLDVKVSKKAEQTFVHIGIDCLILDGWSINMFLHQLVAAYNGESYDVTDYTFRNYLCEERGWLRDKKYYRDAKRYWEENIEKLPPAPHLPMKTAITEIHNPEFGRKRFELSRNETLALFQRIKSYEMTPSLVLCSAYMMSLSKWSENPNVTLNLTMFNRQPIHPDVNKILGDFTNIALLGYYAREDFNFMEIVESMKMQLWNAIEYRSFNVINLLGRLAEKHGDAVAAPYVFTSLIDSDAEGTEQTMTNIGFEEIFAQTQTPQVVLDHQLYVRNGKLLLVLDYVKQAFDNEILDRIFADYTSRVKLLANMEDWSLLYE